MMDHRQFTPKKNSIYCENCNRDAHAHIMGMCPAPPEMTFPPKYNSGGQRSNCEECNADLIIGDTVKPSLCSGCFKALPASVRKLLLGSGKVLCEPGSFEWMEAHARSIRDAKGPEYTVGSSNRLDNFDVAASQLGTTPFIILAVFAAKHWASILSYCRNPDKEMSEPIEDRIADMINYLLLLYLMVHRDKKNAP